MRAGRSRSLASKRSGFAVSGADQNCPGPARFDSFRSRRSRPDRRKPSRSNALGALPVALSKAAGEIGGRGEPALESHLRQRTLRCVGHHVERPLEAQPLHELTRGLPEQRLEHALEVERRDVGGLGHRLQAQRLRQFAQDVVDRAVHAFDIRRGDARSPAAFRIRPQDLASRGRGLLACSRFSLARASGRIATTACPASFKSGPARVQHLQRRFE